MYDYRYKKGFYSQGFYSTLWQLKEEEDANAVRLYRITGASSLLRHLSWLLLLLPHLRLLSRLLLLISTMPTSLSRSHRTFSNQTPKPHGILIGGGGGWSWHGQPGAWRRRLDECTAPYQSFHILMSNIAKPPHAVFAMTWLLHVAIQLQQSSLYMYLPLSLALCTHCNTIITSFTSSWRSLTANRTF